MAFELPESLIKKGVREVTEEELAEMKKIDKRFSADEDEDEE